MARDLLELKDMHHISGVPVLEGADLVGIVTNRDVRYQGDLDAPVSTIMTPKVRLVTVGESPNPDRRSFSEGTVQLLEVHLVNRAKRRRHCDSNRRIQAS